MSVTKPRTPAELQHNDGSTHSQCEWHDVGDTYWYRHTITPTEMSENNSQPPEFHKDGFKYWEYRYDVGDTYWYRQEATPMLVKHYEKLTSNGEARNVLVPLCGKSLDLEWLSKQGVPSVVGVDGVYSVLQTVMTRSGQQWTEAAAPGLGSDSKLLSRTDGSMKLYSGDILNFTSQMEGQFHAMWERGALIILPRADIKRYVRMLKDLLVSGGRILLESIEFDINGLDPVKDLKAFPPFAMFSEEIRSLFEPECSVESIDRAPCAWTYGKYTDLVMYLIIKK